MILGAPRRAPNRFLALFLALIAANQTFEIVRLTQPMGSPAHLVWFRLSSLSAALDPAVLYLFAARHPRPNGLGARVPLALVLGAGALLALLSAYLAPAAIADGPQMLVYVGWAAYTAIVYTVVLARFGRDVAEDPTRPGARLLFAGLCLAALPAWPRVFENGIVALERYDLVLLPDWRLAAYLAFWIGLPLAAFAAAALVAHRRAPEAAAVVTWSLAAGVLLTLVLLAPRGYDVTRSVSPSLAALLGLVRPVVPHAVPIRWWLFGLLVSTAIVRDQLLGLSLAARRRAARILVAAAFLLLGVVLVAIASAVMGELLTPRPLDLLLLGALLVASQRFHALVDRVAARVYGVPLAGAPAAYAAYRSAARQAEREPRGPDADARLARLRQELGIDEETARALEAYARGEPAGPLVPGDRLSGRYEVGRLLARGGAGRVFAARDTLLQRDVVVKELLHDDMGNEAAALAEARAAGALQHPNVLVVFDVLHRPGASYIITEPAEGGSLEHRLQRAPPLAPTEAQAILDGILAGLAAVHEKGLIHRDLKPGNVVLLQNGIPKLADFGLARLHRAATLGAGLVAGTPGFMAPEQRAGEPATMASDIYAVGLLARRLLAEPPAPVEHVIAKALEADPARRWEDAGAMRAALAQAWRAPRPT